MRPPLRAALLAAMVVASLLALPAAPAPPQPAQEGCAAGSRFAARFTEEPLGGTWAPFYAEPADPALPPPPAHRDEAREVKELLRQQRARTPAQVAEAQAWDGPATHAWTQRFLGLLTEPGPDAAALNPPRISRAAAILHIAMYDALIAAHAAKHCHLRAPPSWAHPSVRPAVQVPPAPSYPSEHAAAAGAAQVVLEHVFPSKPPGHFAGMAEAAAASRVLLGASYPSDAAAGLDVGRAIGAAVLAARAGDGSDAAWDGTGRLEGPCHWKPTPPAYRELPLEPAWGRVEPFLMDSGDQFRPPPPPPCDGAHYLADYRVLYESSKNLTERQQAVSDHWEAGAGTVSPPGMSLQVALDRSQEHRLATLRAARVMAHTAAALADAGIAAWDAKFAYWGDRPVLAIRRLGWDVHDGLCAGGEDPVLGGCWLPYATTPPFPGYVSGHATFTGAGMEALKHFFPARAGELRGYQTEASNARFYGGIHASFDNEPGIEVGMRIGALAAARAAGDGAGP